MAASPRPIKSQEVTNHEYQVYVSAPLENTASTENSEAHFVGIRFVGAAAHWKIRSPQKMTNLTIKTGTEKDFFKRGRQLAKAADRGEQLLDGRIVSFEDPALTEEFEGKDTNHAVTAETNPKLLAAWAHEAASKI